MDDDTIMARSRVCHVLQHDAGAERTFGLADRAVVANLTASAQQSATQLAFPQQHGQRATRPQPAMHLLQALLNARALDDSMRVGVDRVVAALVLSLHRRDVEILAAMEGAITTRIPEFGEYEGARGADAHAYLQHVACALGVEISQSRKRARAFVSPQITRYEMGDPSVADAAALYAIEMTEEMVAARPAELRRAARLVIPFAPHDAPHDKRMSLVRAALGCDVTTADACFMGAACGPVVESTDLGVSACPTHAYDLLRLGVRLPWSGKCTFCGGPTPEPRYRVCPAHAREPRYFEGVAAGSGLWHRIDAPDAMAACLSGVPAHSNRWVIGRLMERFGATPELLAKWTTPSARLCDVATCTAGGGRCATCSAALCPRHMRGHATPCFTAYAAIAVATESDELDLDSAFVPRTV
jgi:hypothetical protein